MGRWTRRPCHAGPVPMPVRGMSRSGGQRDMDVTLAEGLNFRSHIPTSLCLKRVSKMNSACEETPIPHVSTCGPTCTWVIQVSVTSERDIERDIERDGRPVGRSVGRRRAEDIVRGNLRLQLLHSSAGIGYVFKQIMSKRSSHGRRRSRDHGR